MFAQEYTPDLWIVGTRDGSFKRFRVEPPRAPDWVTLAGFFDLTLHSTSRDGKHALFYLNNAPKGEAVARLDLQTWSLAIASQGREDDDFHGWQRRFSG